MHILHLGILLTPIHATISKEAKFELGPKKGHFWFAKSSVSQSLSVCPWTPVIHSEMILEAAAMLSKEDWN